MSTITRKFRVMPGIARKMEIDSNLTYREALTMQGISVDDYTINVDGVAVNGSDRVDSSQGEIFLMRQVKGN